LDETKSLECGLLTLVGKWCILYIERVVIVKFNISMPDEFYKKLKEKAAEKNMSISEYIRFALTLLWERGI